MSVLLMSLKALAISLIEPAKANILAESPSDLVRPPTMSPEPPEAPPEPLLPPLLKGFLKFFNSPRVLDRAFTERAILDTTNHPADAVIIPPRILPVFLP